VDVELGSSTGASGRERALPLEAGDQDVEELVDVLPIGAVDAFAVVGTGAGGVLGNGAVGEAA
jgi:hypothetical protein